VTAQLAGRVPPEIQALDEAVERLRWTTRATFARDIRQLFQALAEGPGAEQCRALVAKVALDPWLAACRGEELCGRLAWPADDAEAAGLSIRCIGRFAADPAWAARFAADFFWDEPDADLRLRQLVQEVVGPLPDLLRRVLARSEPRSPPGLLLLGDDGPLRQAVSQALYDLGFVCERLEERPSDGPSTFAARLDGARRWTALVAVASADLAPASLNGLRSPSAAALFDIGFLVGRLGPDRVVPMSEQGLEGTPALARLRPVTVHKALGWRGVLARRLSPENPPQANDADAVPVEMTT